jgi:cephalosporin-C deacetylase
VSTFDLPLDELRAYRPGRSEPDDFDAFWAETLAMSRAACPEPTFTSVDTPLRTVTTFDVTFGGFAGQPIRGWLQVPFGADRPLPAVVEYIGYGGGRSLPHEWLQWASAGYVHLVMDTRGQGAAWSQGDTPDVDVGSATGQYPGFVTRGIDDPRTHYYRRLITDAVLAVDATRSHPLVDADRVMVAGQSQGGGLALAVCGLATGIRGAAIDVPFLCHWRRAIEITDAHPYREVVQYLSVRRGSEAAVLRTLDYVDGVNFAVRASAPALFSVGLMDEICPPSTVFAAYNHYAGPKEMSVWPYNGHDAGERRQQDERYRFFAGLEPRP